MVDYVIYHFLAEEELNDSVDFYEERERGLGFKFQNQVKEKIETIVKHPERFPNRKGYYRETLVKGFPFLIVYRYNKLKRLITISSIYHTSRNAKYKYRK